MEQLNALTAKLETTIGIEAPYLKMAFKATLALIAFFVAWFILRVVLDFIEKRMQKIKSIDVQEALFKIFRKALLYALILITGTYLIELFNIPFGVKFFLCPLHHSVCRTGQEIPGRHDSVFAGPGGQKNR